MNCVIEISASPFLPPSKQRVKIDEKIPYHHFLCWSESYNGRNCRCCDRFELDDDRLALN